MLTARNAVPEAVADGCLRTGENYYIRQLHSSEFSLAAALDRKIYENLPLENRVFFNPHDEDWYREYAEFGNKIYGIFLASGTLTAKANLAFGTDRLEPFGVDPHSKTYRNNSPQTLAILSGGAVDPDYQGHGLQKNPDENAYGRGITGRCHKSAYNHPCKKTHPVLCRR